MRVFYFTIANLGSCESGAKSHIEGVLYGLHRLGWEITLFSSSESVKSDQPVFPFKHVLTVRRNSSLLWQMWEQIKLAFKLVFWCGDRPGCIYIRAYYSLVFPALWAAVRRIPYFIEINALAEIEGKHKWLIPIAVVVENYVLGSARGVFSVTEELTDYFIKRTRARPSKFYTIPNGCERRLCEKPVLPPCSKRPPTVGFLGNFQERQGVETLLRATVILRSEIPDLRVVIAGTGSQEHLYRCLVDELGIAEHVQFVGFVPADSVHQLLQTFDVAVAPYYDKLRYLPMGSPLKIYTYLASGKTVVTGDLPSLQIFADCPAVKFAKADCPEDFAKSISKLLAIDRHERTELGRRGQQWVLEGHTWDHVAKRTADAIEDLCKE